MTDPIFQLSRVSGVPVENDELLTDLRRVAELIGSEKITQHKYTELGLYDCSTHVRRFGSWNQALLVAGLSISNRVDISDKELFENILCLWQYYGCQPRRSQLSRLPSTISQSPYNRRFGSWTETLKAFVEYANSTELELIEKASTETVQSSPTTGRDPSLRLRWQILKRDRFTCCSCGASPALTLGVELHVDHIIPWSKGGKTIIENLQTLCSHCNLGKSNIHDS
jgi:HNH endonuclease/Homing endonuclease associated repeat